MGKALRQDGACDLRGCHLPVLPCVVLVYAFRGALPLGEALPYLVGGLAGGWIGGRLFKDVPNTWLKRIFALFLLYGAVRYLL